MAQALSMIIMLIKRLAFDKDLNFILVLCFNYKNVHTKKSCNFVFYKWCGLFIERYVNDDVESNEMITTIDMWKYMWNLYPVLICQRWRRKDVIVSQ